MREYGKTEEYEGAPEGDLNIIEKEYCNILYLRAEEK